MLNIFDPATIAAVVAVMNGAAFAAFGIDKASARNGGWRIREATLLQLALFGGVAGAYAGRRVFRHKTRKQPFNGRLATIAIVQAAVVAGVIVYTW